MIKSLHKFFSAAAAATEGRNSVSQPPGAPRVPAGTNLDQLLNNPVKYFTTEARYPAVSTDELLATRKQSIAEMRHATALPKETFDAYALPVLRRFTDYVHLLPASETHHHCAPGGLLIHSTDVADLATHFAEDKVFGVGESPSLRRQLEPRYRLAVMIGALLHDVGKAYSDVTVFDMGNAKREWCPACGSLYEWLCTNQVSEYFIQWRGGERDKRHERTGIVLADRIIGPETARWLVEPGRRVITDLYDVLLGVEDLDNPLAGLIKRADRVSTDQNIVAMSKNQIAAGAGIEKGVPLRVVRALQRMVHQRSTRPNEMGHPLWVTDRGVFAEDSLLHEAALNAAKEGDGKMPLNPDTIIQEMLEHNYLTHYIGPNGSQRRYWRIRVHVAEGPPIESTAVRFDRPELVFGAEPSPSPLRVTVLQPEGEQNVAPPPVPAVEEGTTILETNPPHQTPPREPVTTSTTGPARKGPIQLLQTNRSVEDEAESRHEFVEQEGWKSERGSPVNVEDAQAFVDALGHTGTHLKWLVSKTASGALVFGKDYELIEGRLHYAHPQAFHGRGVEPGHVLKSLGKAKCIDPNFDCGERLSVNADIGGVNTNTFRLNRAATAAVLILTRVQNPNFSSISVSDVLTSHGELPGPHGRRHE